MAGAPVHRGQRAARLVAVALLAALPLPLSSTATAAGDRSGLRLPAPVREVDPLTTAQLGLRPDRLLKSQVPGTVHDDEHVVVALGPSGSPTAVTDTQRLDIRGAGNYIVRELGPAREAVGLGVTVPPVLELGTVVWQGFSPGRRVLSARLTLDPGIEAARLPMTVRLEFHDRNGVRRPLGAGAAAPRAGTVTVSLSNNTASNRVVDTGEVTASDLAPALDRLRRAADRPRAAVPPTAGHGLPSRLAGTTTGRVALDVVAPLRVTGTISAPGGSAAVTGPATTPASGGASIAGTLTTGAAFTVRVAAGDRIGLDLDVRPWLEPRTLAPPAPAHTWRQWARRSPSDAAVARATQTLISGAAAAARSAEYSPYLQADAPGPDLSRFTYVVAPPRGAPRLAADMQPRPGAIAAAAVALLAVIGNAEMLRRRL